MLCEHYWPADPTPITHGHIMVHLLAEEPEDEWTKREFQLQHVRAPGDRAAGTVQGSWLGRGEGGTGRLKFSPKLHSER